MTDLATKGSDAQDVCNLMPPSPFPEKGFTESLPGPEGWLLLFNKLTKRLVIKLN